VKTISERAAKGFKREENLATEAYIFHSKTVFKTNWSEWGYRGAVVSIFLSGLSIITAVYIYIYIYIYITILIPIVILNTILYIYIVYIII